MSLLCVWQRSLRRSAIFPRSDLSSNSISDATHFVGIGSRAHASPGIVGRTFVPSQSLFSSGSVFSQLERSAAALPAALRALDLILPASRP